MDVKKSYQKYPNKQILERIAKKENEEGDLLIRSSRSTGNMDKNMDVKASSDSIKLRGNERQKPTKNSFSVLLY